MSRTRILGSLAAAVIGITLLGACSTESLTEAAVNFGLEQAIEGSEDIDVDFGDDGSGGFSISTEEGDFAINFDEDSGGIVFDTDEGEGVISFDEDGIVFDTDEGDGVISFDQDNGEIVFDTDAGDGVISFDEDNGTVSFEGDGGSAIFGANDVPAEWPASIGVPQTIDVTASHFSRVVTDNGLVMTGAFEHAADEAFAETTKDTLIATGWTLVVEGGNAENRQLHFANEADGSSVIVGTQGATNTTVAIVTKD